MIDHPLLLTLPVWIPLFIAVVLPFVAARWVRPLVLAVAVLALVCGGLVHLSFWLVPGVDERHLSEVILHAGWGVAWRLAAGPIAAPLLALTGLIATIAVGSAWSLLAPSTTPNQHAVERLPQPRLCGVLLCLLFAGMWGVFAARDGILLYTFWELLLIPMFLLIAVFGAEQRRYAAIKFALMSFAGSLLLLAGLLLLWSAIPLAGLTVRAADGVVHVVHRTFDLRELPLLWRHWTTITVAGCRLDNLAFACMATAFLVKLPALPFHTWLPHAHVQAPTAISVVLAGVLLKLGSYGLLAVAVPLCPTAAVAWGPLLAWIGVAGLLWAAVVALAQVDLKRLVAYSSISHMGWVLIGIGSGTAAGLSGAAVQGITHGIGAAALFLLVGVVYDRAHHRRIDDFGGLWQPMPVFGAVAIITFLAAAGVPGLAGFPGEWLAFLGAVQGEGTAWIAAMSVISLVLGAAYMLWALKRLCFGPVNPARAADADLDGRERWLLLPLAGLLIIVGVVPSLITRVTDPGVMALVHRLAEAKGGPWP
jgi:NADH-quinone oxidoreductase subunit M